MMRRAWFVAACTGLALFGWLTGLAGADDALVRVDARSPGRPVSKYLTGACIEDVNHEIYGGIYSQMLFGEAFQEPAPTRPITGFVAVEGEWRAADGVVQGNAGPGPKLVSTLPAFAVGEVGVEVFLPGTAGGNAGLITKVDRPGPGADNFDGYEISFDVGKKTLVLGRHQHDWRLLKEVPCDIEADRWNTLAVKMTERTLEVTVNGKPVASYEDDRPLVRGTFGLRQWQRPAQYRNLWVKTGDRRVDVPLAAEPGDPVAVSGMWRAVQTGKARIAASLDTTRPFIGTHSQRLSFVGGTGTVGVENQGLNRWGLAFVAGRPYEGHLWVRADEAVEVTVGLESRDGTRRYAENRLAVKPGEWQKLTFQLTPSQADGHGRFVVSLAAPGTVVLGQAFLQPGSWGRYLGLPVRRDVVQGLIDQGVTVLRYGGSMVNAPEYRWKKMIGPRDRRVPYRGTWYPHSSNGWGIVDFLELCEACGFLSIPAFHMDETPQDLADFVEYVNGPADSPWGQRRVADGHPAPYHLRYLELGNEERVDAAYFEKFRAQAQAIWAKDPQITLVVGDFVYDHPIVDPYQFTGAASQITTLAAHEQILQLAKAHNREVWFDIHIDTNGPGVSGSTRALATYADALQKISHGARHHVVVFELNSGNPRQRRALANAHAIGLAVRDGRYPVMVSANCLQPDGQNDNGWDQGLLFLNPSQVWLQPPGYVTQMISRNYQPRVLEAQVTDSPLDVTVTRSADGQSLVLLVVNRDERPQTTRIEVAGFELAGKQATAEELAGPLEAQNTAAAPEQIKPRPLPLTYDKTQGLKSVTFSPYSFTVVRID
ncbi:MAG: DUF1080 domain-containing protein [Planctomycetes bacterium]|nr:DUF1080 domain-containing protein [Planctomycetota bacterium]